MGFEASIKDADQLFDLYEKERLAAAPRVPEEIEVLKRAALILSVTALETYLEDFLRERFTPRLAAAKCPSDLQNAFNTVATKWLDSNRGTQQSTLADWTGDGWKLKIRYYFNNQIAILNTPNSENCLRLFKIFLAVNLEDYWKWRGYNFASAASRLDKIINVRGKVTHLARKLTTAIPTKHVVSRLDLISYMQFVKEICSATDKVA